MRSGPWLGAEASADRFAEDGLGRIHQKRAADQRLDDLGDGATTADREFLDALIEISVDFQLQPLGQPQTIRKPGNPLTGGGASIQIN